MKTVPNISGPESDQPVVNLGQTDFLDVLDGATNTNLEDSKKVEEDVPDNENLDRVYCQYCEDTDENCRFCKGAHV